jgi:hypothetical protein
MALRLPNSAVPADRHATWVRVAERIYAEQVGQGWRHQVFRLFRAVFATNRELAAEGGFLFKWMADNYVDAALMVIRRELDIQAGTENLRNLLEDIVEHPEVLTRARYLAEWKPGRDLEFANRIFDSFTPVRVQDDSNADYINPTDVKADLESLVADADRLRVFAERTRAHRTPERGIDPTVTFGELHRPIADVRRVVEKYYAILTLRSVADWEPVAQYDTIGPFTRPWVQDPDAVARAAERDASPLANPDQV